MTSFARLTAVTPSVCATGAMLFDPIAAYPDSRGAGTSAFARSPSACAGNSSRGAFAIRDERLLAREFVQREFAIRLFGQACYFLTDCARLTCVHRVLVTTYPPCWLTMAKRRCALEDQPIWPARWCTLSKNMATRANRNVAGAYYGGRAVGVQTVQGETLRARRLHRVSILIKHFSTCQMSLNRRRMARSCSTVSLQRAGTPLRRLCPPKRAPVYRAEGDYPRQERIHGYYGIGRCNTV